MILDCCPRKVRRDRPEVDPLVRPGAVDAWVRDELAPGGAAASY